MTRAPGDPVRRARVGGFSLLELLTVLAILGLAAGVLAPRLAAMLDSERSGLRAKVIAAVRSGQLEATGRGVPVILVLDAADNTLRAGAAEVRLPRGWRVERAPSDAGAPGTSFEPAPAAAPGRAVPLMAWSPSGLSDAARWRLVDARGRAVTIAADPIDGVRVE